MNTHSFLPVPFFEGGECFKKLRRVSNFIKTLSGKLKEVGEKKCKGPRGMGSFHSHFLTNSYHGN